MLTTLVVLQIFDHAQPALLYLVPGVLIALWGTALVRGEFGLMWEYTEDGSLGEKDTKDTKTVGSAPGIGEKVENSVKDLTNVSEKAKKLNEEGENKQYFFHISIARPKQAAK